MVEPVDMRRGIDGLSVLVEQALQRTPCADSSFVFCNRTGNRIKVLLWDGTGVWLCQRRLHQVGSSGKRSGTGGNGTDFVTMGMVDWRADCTSLGCNPAPYNSIEEMQYWRHFVRLLRYNNT